MPLTVGQAREQVLEHLDNTSGSRFARSGDYTKVDRALRSAQNRCVDDYVKAKGDRFDEQISITTDSDGTAFLGTYQAAAIRGVMLEPTAGNLYLVDEGDKNGDQIPDRSSRDYRINIVRLFTIPPDVQPEDLLMGVVDGAARSWDAFDDWVCLRAARTLGVKDMEGGKRLDGEIDDAAQSVLGQERIPRVLPWPTPRQTLFYLRTLRWTWYAREQQIRFFFGPRNW